ncbi:MAG TPA: DUF2058 family protein [Candidatus Competibacteraceae bacterium]|nr:DUF2058 family protein [Candidatus Competibacteraceae bacterium]
MSLRDQLLKAGLVSADKIKQAEAEARKQAHQGKKDKNAAAAEAERRRQQEAELARKREADRQRNLQREQERQRKEARERARQLIAANRANQKDAEIRYNFQDGRYIRSLRVTAQQQKQLAAGLLGIARNDKDPFDFPLLPREAALKLREIMPEWVILLYEEGGAQEDDWPDWPES